MKIEMADGNTVTLEELLADVEAAKGKFTPTQFCFTHVTVEALLNKLQDLDPEKKFLLYWLDGTKQTVEGPDFRTAINNAGIGRGALRALDFYSGNDETFNYDPKSKTWVKEALEVASTVKGLPKKVGYTAASEQTNCNSTFRRFNPGDGY